MKRQEFGKSPQEREFDALAKRDRLVFGAAFAFFILALVLFGLLESVQ